MTKIAITGASGQYGRLATDGLITLGRAKDLILMTRSPDKLADRAAGRQRIASADGVEVGWTASKHVLDTDFDLAKNVVA